MPLESKKSCGSQTCFLDTKEMEIRCRFHKSYPKENSGSFFLILFAGASVFAQSTFGTFVGTVQDQSGSVIAGAMVTITNLDENTVRSATTNSSGQYQLLNVPSGRYSISVVKAGFPPPR